MHIRSIPILTANSTFQQLCSLQLNRKKRQQHGKFLIEGVRLITAALAGGAHIEAFITCHERKLTTWAHQIINRNQSVRIYELAPSLFGELTRRDEEPELMAILRIPQDDLARIQPKHPSLILVLDRPSNPGNLGSILRSADAFKADGVIIFGHAADLYDPVTVSATAESLFTVPSVRVADKDMLLRWLQNYRLENPSLIVLGADEKGTVNVYDLNLTSSAIFVLGNEATGLGKVATEICDELVTIPIGGYASSLNVSSAASICLYEVQRQRAVKN